MNHGNIDVENDIIKLKMELHHLTKRLDRVYTELNLYLTENDVRMEKLFEWKTTGSRCSKCGGDNHNNRSPIYPSSYCLECLPDDYIMPESSITGREIKDNIKKFNAKNN